MYFRVLVTGLLLSTIFIPTAASGQSADAILSASDNDDGDQFGISVSIDRDRILVGAYSDDQLGANAGAAYVFRYDNGWAEEEKLVASSGDESDLFGYSTHIYGNFAIVGAPYEDHSDQKEDAGAAYIFHFDGTTWGEQQRLTASDSAEDDQYGWSVSIADSIAAVGTTWDDNYTGGVYIYRHDGSSWIEEAKLTASDAAEGQRFGGSIDISENRIIVGARFDTELGSNAGAAYIFEYDGSTWTEDTKITASDGTFQDVFGNDVAISDDLAIVGASSRTGAIGIQAGAAYIFRRNAGQWSEEAMLLADDASPASSFGNSVAIEGNRAVIAAYNEDEVATNGGAIYVFNHDGVSWSQESKLNPAELATGDNYGNSVAIDSNIVVVGAPSIDQDTTANVGAVYVYELTPFNPVSVEATPDIDWIPQLTTYPNPTAGATTITLDLPEPTPIVLNVYDTMGRQIANLVAGRTIAGHLQYTWNGTTSNGATVPSGTYFLRLHIPGKSDYHVITKQIVVIR